jgi:ABC-type molybdenum transport system ATPase subunit/photorepair protein PhrA
MVNNGSSKVLIGPNGFGKSKLLSCLQNTHTMRIFSRLPSRMRRYVETSVKRGIEDQKSLSDAETTSELVTQVDADPELAWGCR